MAVREGGVFATVVHYLLYATVALLLVDVFIDVGSHVPLYALALVVAAGFAALAIGRAVRIESGGEIGSAGGIGSESAAESAGTDGSESEAGSGETAGSSGEIGGEREGNRLDELRRSVAKRRITIESVRDPRPADGGRVVPVALLGLLVVGGGLRLYALGAQSFWFDEAISTNAAIALLETGSPTFPSGETYWRAFPHTLVAAGSMLVFGTGEAAARLPSVGFGVATIGVTYWLGRDVGGWRVGLLAAVMVTFATWEIAWSRQARMYALFQLLFVLAVVLLLRVERSWFADRWAVVAVVVVGLLAAATHQIGLVLLPVAIAYLGIVGAIDGRLTTRTAGGLVAGAVGFALLAALVGLDMLDALAGVLEADVSYWDTYYDWFVDEFHAFVALAIVGVTLPFYRGWWRAGLLLVLATGPALWVLSFHTELFATRYLYFALPVVFVWVGVTLAYVGEAVVGRLRVIRDRSVTDSVGSSADRSGEGLRRADRRTRSGGGTDVTAAANGGDGFDGTESPDSDARFIPTMSADAGDGASGTAAPMALGVPIVALALVVFLAIGGGFTVTAQSAYELGVNAPQPDFESAYACVDDHREDGDVIVAGWTAPGVYYAGGVDYWLVHDLTMGGGEWTVNGVERYAGAAPVMTAEELEDVIDEHERGWVVLDDIAVARQDGEMVEVLSADVELVTEREGISVYSWDWGGETARC